MGDLPSAKVTVPVDIKGGIEIDGGIDTESKLKTSVKSEQLDKDIKITKPTGKVDTSCGIVIGKCTGDSKGKSVKGGIDVSADVKMPSVDIKKTTSTKPASDIKVQGGINLDMKTDTKKFGFMAESGSSEEDLTANISIKRTIDLPSTKVTATLPSIDLKGAIAKNIDVSVETKKENPKDVDLSLKAKASKKAEQVKYTKYDEEQSTSSE